MLYLQIGCFGSFTYCFAHFLYTILLYVDATKGWLSVGQSKASDITENATFITATGGTVTCSGNCRIHTFTGPGTFAVSCAGNPSGSNTLDYLVVAGGGSGGTTNGAAGAGGGGVQLPSIVGSCTDLDYVISGCTDSQACNYNSEATSYINLKTNGAIDHESSEVDVIINFRTPIDISAEGPQFDGKAIGVKDFSGLYKVWQVINNFSGNEFTQDVSLIRRRNQKQNVSAGTVSNPRYMDKKAYEKRLAAALETGDPYKIAMAKADLNGDGQLDKFEEDAMGGIYADLTDEELQNAVIMQEGKAFCRTVSSI